MKKLVMPLLIAANLGLNPLMAQRSFQQEAPLASVVHYEEETSFTMSWSDEDDLLLVHLQGKFDKYTSVSVMNQKGEAFFFRFVESNENSFVFDLSELEKGSYKLILNTGDEVRMKRFLKD